MKKVILTTYSHLLYTQNMSEPEERPYAGVQEQNEFQNSKRKKKR
jgi:hypothetical protein